MALSSDSKNVTTIKNTLGVLLIITLVIYVMSIVIAFNHYSDALRTINSIGAKEEFLSAFIQKEVKKHHVSRVNASALLIGITLVALWGLKKENFTILLVTNVALLISNILLSDSMVVKKSVTFSFSLAITLLMSVFTFVVYTKEAKQSKDMTQNLPKIDDIVLQ